jgi:hypothetical protein
MARATGGGGVFLRAADPEKLHAWYEEYLGIKRTEDGAFAFFSEGPREMPNRKRRWRATPTGAPGLAFETWDPPSKGQFHPVLCLQGINNRHSWI